MKYDKFFEDHQEALDRFMDEYQKHQEKKKNQFYFMRDQYRVKEEEVTAINENVVRIREEKLRMKDKTLEYLDGLYGEKTAAYADGHGLEVDQEMVVADLEKAALLLMDWAWEVGEWTDTHVKYFGSLDVLDGVHFDNGIFSLIHSNSSYKAIHVGAFKQMLVMRPEKDVIFFIIETQPVNPFLRTEGLDSERKLLVPQQFQSIYRDFFGAQYHIRLMLCEGDSLWIAPAYLTRRGYNTAKLQEIFLYPEK